MRFVRSFTEIPLPFKGIEAALIRGPERWLPGLADEAGAAADRLLADVGFGPDEHPVRKRVAIELQAPLRRPSRTVVPLTWEATGPGRLFPYLEAELEVAALGPGRTQVAISGQYEPPLGTLGRLLDRALLHRVAETTLRDFLERVAEALEAGSVRTGGRTPNTARRDPAPAVPPPPG